MTGLLRATVSGSYKTSDKHIESFDDVTGIMPALDEDKAIQMIIRRYARVWISQAKKKNAEGQELDEFKYRHIQRIREVFVDNVEDADDLEGKTLSYVGKNIMEMNFEELQDLAAAKDLSCIPLYKVGSLAHARRVAFSEYAIKVLGLEEYAPGDKKMKFNLYDFRVSGFNPARFAAIKADGEIRRDMTHVADIEESLDVENLRMQKKLSEDAPKAPGQPAGRLTLDQLKAIADSKSIQYNANIGFDKLYERIYGKAAA